MSRTLQSAAKNANQTTSAQLSTFNIQPLNGAITSLTNPSTTPDVSIIIPAYCEEDTIHEVLQRVTKVSWSMGNVEIIVVDDGSTDKTGQKVQAFPFVKYIRHKNNQGKGAAIKTGIQAARGKIIVIQDADLEYLPEYIPSLVKPIADGQMDIVYGSRFESRPESMSFSHFIGNSILSFVARFLYSIKITDIMTGQKAFRQSIIQSIKLEENGFAVEIELTCLSLNGHRHGTYHEVPIPYAYRQYGISKIGYMDGVKSLVKLFALYLRSD